MTSQDSSNPHRAIVGSAMEGSVADSGEVGRFGLCRTPNCHAIAIVCVVCVPMLLCEALGLPGNANQVLCRACHSIGCCAVVGCGRPIFTKMYSVQTYRGQINGEISTEHGEGGWNSKGFVVCWRCLHPGLSGGIKPPQIHITAPG